MPRRRGTWWINRRHLERACLLYEHIGAHLAAVHEEYSTDVPDVAKLLEGLMLGCSEAQLAIHRIIERLSTHLTPTE